MEAAFRRRAPRNSSQGARGPGECAAASHHLERILSSPLFRATNFLIARKLPKAEAGASTL